MTDLITKAGDPLQDLFVDGAEIDRKLLASLLRDYIGIDSKTFKPVFKGGFHDLDAKTKLLNYLLYKKALSVTGKISREEESEKPKEISKVTGVNYNSTRSYLSQLRTAGLVDMEEGGSYFIPGYSLPKIASLRKKEEDE
jgi:Mn-dependent DtxR family transcriptional regulator